MAAVSLQNVLDASSYYLGESGTPTTDQTKRILFANEAKKNIRDLRNWTWELTDATPINIVNGINYYTLPADLKDKQSVWTVKVTDANNNSTFYNPVEEQAWDNITINQLDDTVYWVKGNTVSGYTIYINPTPTVSVTNGLNIRYYNYEGDFVNTTDTTRIPKEEAIAWYIAAKMLYSYREQAQYQLAMQEYQNAIDDLSMLDQKTNPFTADNVQTLRQAQGASNDFRTYY